MEADDYIYEDDDEEEDEMEYATTNDHFRESVLATAQALIDQEQEQRQQHEDQWEEYVAQRAVALEQELGRELTHRQLGELYNELALNPEAEIEVDRYDVDLGDDDTRADYMVELVGDLQAEGTGDEGAVEDGAE